MPRRLARQLSPKLMPVPRSNLSADPVYYGPRSPFADEWPTIFLRSFRYFIGLADRFGQRRNWPLWIRVFNDHLSWDCVYWHPGLAGESKELQLSRECRRSRSEREIGNGTG